MEFNVLDSLNNIIKKFINEKIEDNRKTFKTEYGIEAPLLSTIKIPEIPTIDGPINAELKPIEASLDEFTSKTIKMDSPNIRSNLNVYCKVCGKQMTQSEIYPYKSRMIRRYVCMNPECPNCNHIVF